MKATAANKPTAFRPYTHVKGKVYATMDSDKWEDQILAIVESYHAIAPLPDDLDPDVKKILRHALILKPTIERWRAERIESRAHRWAADPLFDPARIPASRDVDDQCRHAVEHAESVCAANPYDLWRKDEVKKAQAAWAERLAWHHDCAIREDAKRYPNTQEPLAKAA